MFALLPLVIAALLASPSAGATTGGSVPHVVGSPVIPSTPGRTEDTVHHAPQRVDAGKMGNANFYMDMVLRMVDRKMKRKGLDPMLLPNVTLHVKNLINAELVNGTLSGLSTLHRSGTATVDTVADWIFLYANIALGPITAAYPGIITNVDGTNDTFEATVGLDVIDIYVTGRGNTFDRVLDLDQFVISEMGPAKVDIKGLGILGWLTGPLSEAILNLFMGDVQSMLSNQIKEAIQKILNETPWPES